jgi:hypothetical protein
MFKYIKTFFKPDTLIYSYNKPKELIIDKIYKSFEEKVTFFSDRDTKCSFINDDTFELSSTSPAWTNNIKYSSTLIGKIIELENGTCQIKIQIKSGIVFFIFFFITPIFGIIYFFEFTKTSLISYLFWGLGMFIIGPILSISIASVGNSGILKRFEMYIDKVLKN